MIDATGALEKQFYMALAFQAAFTSDKDFYAPGTSKRIIDMAQKISDFCKLYAPNITDIPTVNLVNEAGAEKLDTTIEEFILQRRKDISIALPEDEGMLIKLYDRLQLRAARRINRLLLAQITREKLTRFILAQIDQEIEDAGAQ